MNRKLLNGLLLFTVAACGVGTFTSCKDEDSVVTDLQVGQRQLGDLVNAIRNVTDGPFQQNLAEWLDNRIKEVSSDLNPNYSSLRELVEEVSYLDGEVEALKARVDSIEDWDSIADLLLQDLTSRVDSLENWQSDVDNTLDMLIAQGVANAYAIEKLQENMLRYDNALHFMQEDINNLVAQNQDIISKLTQEIINRENADKALQDQINSFNQQVSGIFSFLANKFAHLVTSIQVHQTFNPIFGTINLPIGLQTNFVGGYFFNSEHNINTGAGNMTFPIVDNTSYEYWTNNPDVNGETPEIIKYLLTQLDNPFKAQAGVPMVENSNNNLGTIYLSVNPRNVNYNGLEVSLVNSQDEEILASSDLKLYISDEVLSFGVNAPTRAENGSLYELPVSVKANWDDLNQIAFDFENKKELLDAFKSAIQNREITDFAKLGKILYDKIHDFLPAYGVKVSWQDQTVTIDENGEPVVSDQVNSVVSNYNIAAMVAHPLSFKSIPRSEGNTGFSIPENIGTIGDIAEQIVERIKKEVNFYLSKADIDANDLNITIDFSDIKVNWEDLDIVIDLSGMPIVKDQGTTATNGTIVGYVPAGTEIHLTNNGLGQYEYEGDLSELLTALQGGMDQAFEIAQERLQQSVNQLLQDINEKIAAVQGKIDGKLDEVLGKIQNALKGKLAWADSLIELYNKIAPRLNQLLSNPNYYLQAYMAYEGANNSFNRLSTFVNDPTRFQQAGGNCIELFATSYNAEIIVPIFKKYVAITGVYYPWGVQIPGGGFDLVKLNAAAGLNKIFEGRQQKVALDVTNTEYFQPGYVYEIYYSALDYRGYTSTRKYYFTIVK